LSLFRIASPLLAALIAMGSAWAGIVLSARERSFRLLVPLSGAFLVAIAVFGLIPELAAEIGWVRDLALVAAGFVTLAAIDRFVFSICPSDEHGGAQAFAASLLIATGIHAFVDGWGMVAAQEAAPRTGVAVALAIFLHKVPEGLALGTILRRSFGEAGRALLWCGVVEVATVPGGLVALWIGEQTWTSYPLAVVSGALLFLGLHAAWSRGHAENAG
jgi:zinc transporter ZupT